MAEIRKLLSIGLGAALLCASTLATAAEFGTADEAKGMLERAITAVQADKDKALADFTAGAEGFKEKDLYVFCGGADGNFTAHGSKADLVGQSLRDLQDKAGNALGEDMYSSAVEGEVSEVEYLWPRPGEEEPVAKVSYVTKIDDQVCGVGYYKQ